MFRPFLSVIINLLPTHLVCNKNLRYIGEVTLASLIQVGKERERARLHELEYISYGH